MQVAIDKAKASGMAIAAVRNSAHFGATGYYTLMAAKQGLIGMACTSASGIQVAPTFGKQARLGTDPWSFAAPARDGEPFLLDMATTTVAAGRIRNKANEGLPTPDGWVLDSEGRPSNDPLVAREKGGFLTSLGGSPENSSYKGYGLAAMVNILASCLSGATLITDPMHTKKPEGMDIGHFFMAIDPGLFREADEFQSDVAQFCGDLRATTPVDPAQPVMVAGDPQWKNAAKRMAEGIPVGPGLLQPGAADRPGVRRAVAAGLGLGQGSRHPLPSPRFAGEGVRRQRLPLPRKRGRLGRGCREATTPRSPRVPPPRVPTPRPCPRRTAR